MTGFIDPMLPPSESASGSPDEIIDPAEWYCVRSKPKSEHIAAAHLRLMEEIDVFCPRIQYYKSTARGKVLFKSAMFPGYLFARFDMEHLKQAVRYAHGVVGLVHFGNFCPPIDEGHILFLRKEVGTEEITTVTAEFRPGDRVEIAEGAFRGLKAIVQTYMPAKDRVRILLEILGNPNPVDVAAETLVPESPQTGGRTGGNSPK